MRPRSPVLIAVLAAVATAASGCGSSTATPTSAQPAPSVSVSAEPSPSATQPSSAASSGGAAPSSAESGVPAIGATIRVGIGYSGGSYLIGPNLLALYTYANDRPDVTTCTGACATTWPPLLLPPQGRLVPPPAVEGTFGTISRPDGTTQIAYNHKPLYFYSGDQAPGQTSGNGIAGVWSLAKP